MKEESLNQTQSNKSGGIIMINVVRHGEICGDTGRTAVTNMVMLHWIMTGPEQAASVVRLRCQVGGAPVWTLTLWTWSRHQGDLAPDSTGPAEQS